MGFREDAQLTDEQVDLGEIIHLLVERVKEQTSEQDEEPEFDLDDAGSVAFQSRGELLDLLQILSTLPEDSAREVAHLLSGAGVAVLNAEVAAESE